MRIKITSFINASLFICLLFHPFMVTPQTAETSLEKASNLLGLDNSNDFDTKQEIMNAFAARHKELNNQKPMKEIWATKHPFSRRVFVENLGQFKDKNNLPEFPIKYGNREEGTQIYFSSNGVLFVHDEYPFISEEQKEKAGDLSGKKLERMFEKLRMIRSTVNIEWIGSNPNVEIESEGIVSDYFMYGKIKANGYKKITYKNIYPKIDIEYTMRPYEEGGMKYVIILHPGADPSLIKMKYSGAKKVKLTEDGNILIKTAWGDIIDHAPETFYNGGDDIPSSFSIDGDVVSFNVGDYDHSRSVLIDPTVSFPGAPDFFGNPGAPTNDAYDVDFDDQGNVFVLGGAAPFTLLKFNNAGTLQWSYDVATSFGAAQSIGAFGTAYGDLAVDKKSGRTYVCEGFALAGGGCRVAKISASGTDLGMFPGDPAFNEMWRMQYNGCVEKMVIAGATSGAGNSKHVALIDTTLATLNSVDVFGANDTRDMAIFAMDDYGDAFIASSIEIANGSKPNDMAKIPLPTFAPVWTVQNGHKHGEFTATSYVVGNTGGFNGMAVSDNMLYTYDGSLIKRWDKGTGAAIDQVVTRTGTADFKCGGITADKCDNVYVGVNATIQVYDSNLALIQTINAPGQVHDVLIGANGVLYACGKGFVESLTAVVCAAQDLNIVITPTGSCGSAGSASAAVTGGSPPYTFLWSDGQTTPTATGLTAGDYTVTVTDGACVQAVATETVTVVSGATVNVGVNSETICSGETVNLIATGATSYTWLPVDGLVSPTGATVVATPTVTTTYTVTGDAGGCVGTAEAVVTVNPTPVVGVNDQAICGGQTATLTATGADTYAWTPGTDLDATTGAVVNSIASATITYTVTGTSNGCSNSAESIVTLSTLPPVNAGADITICSGETGNIGAPAVAGHTYLWTPITDLSDPEVANPTVTSINNTGSNVVTTYTVTTDPGGCEASEEVIVTVIPQEDTTFNYSRATFCPPGIESPTVGTPGGAFTVNPGTGLSITAGGDVDLSATTAGTYKITYTTSSACPNATDFDLTVTTNPDATFSYAGPYCQDVANPIPTFPLGSSAGVFSSAGGLVFTDNTTGEIDIAASTAGTYTVTNNIAAGGGCPAATASNTVTINAIPVTTVNDQTVCGGTSATLTAGGATTYLWSTGSTENPLTVNPTVLTSYSVTGTTAGCSSDTVAVVTTNPSPTVTVNSVTICEGQTIRLDAAGADAGSYVWSDASTKDTLSVSPTTLTSYTVTGTALGCPSSAVATVTVNPLPNITVLPTTVCENLEATVVASGGGSYIWLHDTSTTNPHVFTPIATMQDTVFASDAICTDANGLNAFFQCFISGCTNFAAGTVTVTQQPEIEVYSPTICAGETVTLTSTGGSSIVWTPGGEVTSSKQVSPLATTSYTVANNTPGCEASAVATVTVNNPPNISVAPVVICEGTTATLAASGNATTFSWSSGGTNATENISGLASGTSTFTVTGNPGACESLATGTVTINPLPTVTSTNTSICEGETGTLTAGGTATSFSWSNGTSGSTLNDSPLKPQSYTVTGTDLIGCSASASGRIEVYTIPNAAYTFSPDPAGVLEPVITFSNRSSQDVTSWNWNFGDGDTVSSNTKNPIHTYPSVEQNYIVVLDVRNQGGCTDTVSQTIVIGPEFTFFMPNAFSPNQDGINDDFGASGGGILEFQLLIFDRWGEQLFKTTDLNGRWEGNYMGTECVQDTYIWKVNLLDVLKKEHSFIGTVTIIK